MAAGGCAEGGVGRHATLRAPRLRWGAPGGRGIRGTELLGPRCRLDLARMAGTGAGSSPAEQGRCGRAAGSRSRPWASPAGDPGAAGVPGVPERRRGGESPRGPAAPPRPGMERSQAWTSVLCLAPRPSPVTSPGVCFPLSPVLVTPALPLAQTPPRGAAPKPSLPDWTPGPNGPCPQPGPPPTQALPSGSPSHLPVHAERRAMSPPQNLPAGPLAVLSALPTSAHSPPGKQQPPPPTSPPRGPATVFPQGRGGWPCARLPPASSPFEERPPLPHSKSECSPPPRQLRP